MRTKDQKISVAIIALNEEKDLPRCLNSIRPFANEIVVVDSGSTDKTVEIAKRFGAKVYYRKLDNFSNQKNFAAEKATGEWILSLDADEEVPTQLGEEVRLSIYNHRSPIVAYSIPRKNIIFGKLIKYTRWQPEFDRHVWLWKKGKGRWIGDVHEELEADGEVGRLKNAKIHYQYETVREFMDMMNKYSELDAAQRVKNGVKFSLFRFFFDPVYNFLVRYIYRWGFLEGWRGFVLSFLMGVYHLELWIKVWERVKVKQVN